MNKGEQQMICSKCKQQLPDDSEFCQYCGFKLVLEEVRTNDCIENEKKKTKFKFNGISIFIVIIFVFLISFGVYQYVEINSLEQKIYDLENQVEEAEREISDLEHERQKYYNKASFFDDHAELVISDGTDLYHKYDCLKVITSKGFRIFNTSVAELLGYTRCPDCH